MGHVLSPMQRVQKFVNVSRCFGNRLCYNYKGHGKKSSRTILLLMDWIKDVSSSLLVNYCPTDISYKSSRPWANTQTLPLLGSFSAFPVHLFPFHCCCVFCSVDTLLVERFFHLLLRLHFPAMACLKQSQKTWLSDLYFIVWQKPHCLWLNSALTHLIPDRTLTHMVIFMVQMNDFSFCLQKELM